MRTAFLTTEMNRVSHFKHEELGELDTPINIGAQSDVFSAEIGWVSLFSKTSNCQSLCITRLQC